MKKLYLLFFAAFLLASFTTADKQNWKLRSGNPDYLHRSIKQVTDVIVHDIFAPPVACRIYGYVTIAAYEAAIHDHAQYITLAGQLHGLKPLPQPDAGKKYSFPLAAVHAALTVGKALVISEGKMTDFYNGIMEELKRSGMPETVFRNSIAYGQQVATHILAWAAEDNYKQTRSFPKYNVLDDAATWKPTPPAYMKAIEPHWNKIRTFLLDSAQQFKPIPATPFSAEKGSPFFKEAKEVYDAGRNLTAEQKGIASFWDCNPFKMNINGHVMYATKKISPGGHWVNITRLACKKVNADFVQSAEAYACLSIMLGDSFISCWDEKYRSKVIRPETYINQYIDQSWMPLLQTPPFPEYTSGHSVISAAAALMLTELFGANFAFADSSEVEFDLPVRHFTSFQQAAEEAAISRFYGGIHYMPSIVNGMEEGVEIGRFIIGKLRTKKEDIVQKHEKK